MTTMLNDFGSFIDSLRKSRRLSREDFVEGIISIRQYQRYVNGESSLNNEKLFKLIDRLGMNYYNVHKLYFNNNKNENTKLNRVYGEISRGNFVSANELLLDISKRSLYNEYSKSYHKLCELLILKKTNKIPEPVIIDSLKELINYPDCLENKLINFVEYVSFIYISRYLSEKYNDVRILNFLYDKIKNDNILADSILFAYLPSTYALVSRSFGIIDEYEKSLVIAQKGIDWCLRHETHNSLVHLLMYKSISLKSLDQIDEALIASKKAFALLYVEGNENKTEKFTKIFENVFNLKTSEL